MRQDFTYAVARIRFRETRLLSDGDLSSLLAAKDTDSVLRALRDKGWGDNTDLSPEQLLAVEEKKLWEFVDEAVTERSQLDFLRVPDDFHNLKVAVKCITRDIKPDGLFLYNSVCEPEEVYDCVKNRDYGALPEFLAAPAKEAMTALLQTSDGQLCDIIIDRSCMEYVYQLGKQSDDEIIRLYCELFTAAADIKIAVRCANTRKKPEFIIRALADCDTLDTAKLAAAAYESFDSVVDYIGTTDYRSAVDSIQSSMSAFEKWCDDYLTSVMRSQRWEPFGIGAVVAYIIARRNELKAVRMILSAKLNDLPDDMIRERLRDMYV